MDIKVIHVCMYIEIYINIYTYTYRMFYKIFKILELKKNKVVRGSIV